MHIPERLQGLEWELPHNFLGLSPEDSNFENAGVVILPVPYEATVSYGTGTAHGPRAILESSRFIELYDQELDSEPSEIGIATLPSLALTGAGPEAALKELRHAYDGLLEAASDKLIVMLGGEHSISSAPILAWADRLQKDGRRLSVLQFDAHTDLRPEYEGSAYSHAAVMHRVHDRVDLVAVGIRATVTTSTCSSRTIFTPATLGWMKCSRTLATTCTSHSTSTASIRHSFRRRERPSRAACSGIPC